MKFGTYISDGETDLGETATDRETEGSRGREKSQGGTEERRRNKKTDPPAGICEGMTFYKEIYFSYTIT